MLINLLHQCNWFWLHDRLSQLLFIRAVWTDHFFLLLLFDSWTGKVEEWNSSLFSFLLLTTRGLCMAWNETIDLVSGTPSIECMEREGKRRRTVTRGGEDSDLSTSAPTSSPVATKYAWLGLERLLWGNWWKGCVPHSSYLLGSWREHLGNTNNIYLNIHFCPSQNTLSHQFCWEICSAFFIIKFEVALVPISMVSSATPTCRVSWLYSCLCRGFFAAFWYREITPMFSSSLQQLL